MDTPLAIQDARPLTVAEVKEQVNLIQQIMAEVMQEGHHYGVIPGCDKPCLFKAGTEKLQLTFSIVLDPEAEDLSTEGIVRYRVRSRASTASGRPLGSGLGECSSGEEKYMWRKAVCKEEWDETAEGRRRIKWQKGKKGSTYQVAQVRLEPASQANTILKMAEKRANVNVILKVTAASDIFTQDLEDDEHPQGPGDKAPMKRPKAKAKTTPAAPPNGGDAPPNAITGPQGKRFYAKYTQAGKSDEEVKAYLLATYNITSSKQITRDIYDDLCAWAEAPSVDDQGAPEPGGPDDIEY